MVTAFGSSSNVFEVLDKDNYLDWSETTQAYLMAQDLWDVVHSHHQHLRGREKKAWEKKNAAALHAIRISCGQRNLHFIRGIFEANKAWQTLKETFDPQPEKPANMASTSHNNSLDQITDEENGICNDYKESLKSLQDALSNYNRDRLVELCVNTPGLLKEKNPNRKNEPVLLDFLSTGLCGKPLIETLKSDEFPREAWDMKNSSGGTALTVAVTGGSIDAVKCIVEMKPELLSIPNNSGHLPVVIAIRFHIHDRADYLYQETPVDVWSQKDGEFGATLIINCIKVRKLDIAIKLLEKHYNLMLAKDANGKTPMYYAARVPSLFRVAYHHRFLPTWISNWLGQRLPLKLIRKYSMNMKVSGIELLDYMRKAVKDSKNDPTKTGLVKDEILEAIKQGNFFVFLTINASFMNFADDPNGTFTFMCLRTAIEHRQAKVFSYLYYTLYYNDDQRKRWTNVWRDEFNNNILHIAGKLAPPTVLDRISGPALQAQRELRWFKELEELVPDSCLTSQNIDYMTPQDLFNENHKDLMVEARKWMKDSGTSWSVVGPLIITIMFAAAFQVPGGNNPDGFPIFSNKKLFKLYMVLVSISLFSATLSVLKYLEILSLNKDKDFVSSLKTYNVITGTLFLSLATMMAAFCTGLYLTLRGELRIFMPIAAVATYLVGYIVCAKLPLLVESFTFIKWRTVLDYWDIDFEVEYIFRILKQLDTKL